ncbi:hypothetical protein ABPG74_019900 [Tetrahymena malaccensis]
MGCQIAKQPTTNKQNYTFNLIPEEIILNSERYQYYFYNKEIINSISKLYQTENERVIFLGQDFKENTLIYKLQNANSIKIIQLTPIFSAFQVLENLKNVSKLHGQEIIYQKESLPPFPNEIIQAKTKVIVQDCKYVNQQFDLVEANYDGFIKFASNFLSKDWHFFDSFICENTNINTPIKIKPICFTRYYNQILVQDYLASIFYRKSSKIKSIYDAREYFNLNDFLIDIERFIFLKQLTVWIKKSNDENDQNYPINLIKYISAQKKSLKSLNLRFIEYDERVIDPQFCEELQKCSQLKFLQIDLSNEEYIYQQNRLKILPELQSKQAELIGQSIQNMNNLQKVDLKIKVNPEKDYPYIQLFKKDCINEELKELNLEQHFSNSGEAQLKKQIFVYDLQFIENAPNLQNLTLSLLNVEFVQSNAIKKLSKLLNLRKFNFKFNYSLIGEWLQIMKDTFKQCKSLEIVTEIMYIKNYDNYFELQYDKQGVIRKIDLSFQNMKNESDDLQKILEKNIEKYYLLKEQIQNSWITSSFITLFFKKGCFEKEDFIEIIIFLNLKFKIHSLFIFTSIVDQWNDSKKFDSKVLRSLKKQPYLVKFSFDFKSPYYLFNSSKM